MSRTLFAFAIPVVLGALAVAAAGTATRPAPLPTFLEQPDLKPTPALGAIASAVALTLTTAHYTGQPIDDTRSRLWLDRYLGDLDPQRLYLLQSDIDEFSRFAVTQDDDILSGQPQLEAPYVIHARFRQRVSERVDAIQRILDGPIHLDDPKATVEVDRKDDPWARDSAELDRVWQARVTEQVLSMKLGEERPEDPVVRLKKRYERIRKDSADIDVEDILELWLAALASTFDPHSVWFKPITKENFDVEMQDTLIGIGAELRNEEGYTVINKLIVGGPAFKSCKLRERDTILAVAQGDEPPVDVVDMRIDRVVQLIRGTEGTDVVLTIHPGDATDPAETKQVRLVREKVKLADAAAKGEIHEVDGPNGKVNLGVIEIPSFYVDSEGEQAGDPNFGSTARDVARIITGWNGQADALLLDLRNNGGGSLDQALELTGLFIDNGPVVQIRSRDDQTEVLRDPSPGALYTGPLVVLTSELAASASEIFAGAIQDYRRGLIVGSETTHGKGSVQNLVSLGRHLVRMGHPEAAERGGALKFTTHMFFRVNGDSTQINGVTSDVVLPSPWVGLDIGEKDLDDALEWDRIPSARYRELPWRVDLTALRQASAARVASDIEFQWLREDIAERDRLEKLTTLSLDFATRKAELDAEKARSEAREVIRNGGILPAEDPAPTVTSDCPVGTKDDKPELDAILDESLQVSRDYVDLLRGRPLATPGTAAR